MKRVLEVGGVLALLSVAAFFVSLTYFGWKTWTARGEALAAVVTRLDAETAKANAVLDAVRTVPATVDKHLTNVEKTVNNAVGKGSAQVGATLSIVQDTVGRADKQLTAIESKVDPLVQSYTNLGNQAAGAVVDLRQTAAAYSDDFDNLVQSSEVAVTSAARIEDNVAKDMPVYTEQVKKIGAAATGVAEDVKREADAITAPKPWYTKILSPAYVAARIIGIFW